jgi:hypothetical protein
MRGVWRDFALCGAAPITRGKFILVIKGVYLGRVHGHTGQIWKITEILENWHLDGPCLGGARGGLGIKNSPPRGSVHHWTVFLGPCWLNL